MAETNTPVENRSPKRPKPQGGDHPPGDQGPDNRSGNRPPRPNGKKRPENPDRPRPNGRPPRPDGGNPARGRPKIAKPGQKPLRRSPTGNRPPRPNGLNGPNLKKDTKKDSPEMTEGGIYTQTVRENPDPQAKKKTETAKDVYKKNEKDAKKLKKKGGKRKDRIAYSTPSKLAGAVNSMGFKYDLKSMAISYGAMVIVCIIVGIIMDLKPAFMVASIIITALYFPGFIYRSYFNKMQQRRFDDVNIYMEQILYAFRTHKMVLPALRDVETQFTDGMMKDALNDAIDYMLSPQSDDMDTTDTALKFISDKYPCDKVITVHQFMSKVEKLGGNFDATVDLLLQDRNAWEMRQVEIQKMRGEKKRNVLLSCIMSILLCVVFLRVMPEQYNITQNLLCQISSVVMWFFMLLLYSMADKKATVDLLAGVNDMTEEQAKKKYMKLAEWDDKAQARKSYVYAIVTGIVGILIGIVMKKPLVIGGALVVAVGMSQQHVLDRKLSTKSLIDEIHLKFPRWMIEMSLLLQTESVQVALKKSVQTAPAVLLPELELMQERLEKAPESVEPFLDFLGMFHLKDVQSAMSMLHSIQSGAGGDPETQIIDIVRRNNQMLEITEKKVADNAMASLSGLFMMPLLFGAAKLMVDMVAFMGVAFGSMM